MGSPPLAGGLGGGRTVKSLRTMSKASKLADEAVPKADQQAAYGRGTGAEGADEDAAVVGEDRRAAVIPAELCGLCAENF